MEALNAIKLAIQMEQKAAEFYRQAAEQTGDTQAREILYRFSSDETKHGQLLQTLVDNYYIKNNRFDIPELTVAEYAINKNGPIYGKRMEELSSQPDPVAAAVDKFAAAESEAIKLYRKLARETEDVTLGKFFTKLAGWEEKHLALLKKQAEVFKNFKQKP